MKEEEFRIGNWVRRFSENGRYIQYEKVEIIRFHKFKSSYIEPILLTEEILLKSGFEYELGYGYRNKSITGLLLKSIGTSDYNVFTYCGITIEIPFLHQLQNLYFALTLEELEINL